MCQPAQRKWRWKREPDPPTKLLGIGWKKDQRGEEGQETPENLMGCEKAPNSWWTCLHEQEEQWEALARACHDPLRTWRGHSPAAAWQHGLSVQGVWALKTTSTFKSALISLLMNRWWSSCSYYQHMSWGNGPSAGVLCAKMRKVNSTPLITTIALCAFDLQSTLQTLAN